MSSKDLTAKLQETVTWCELRNVLLSSLTEEGRRPNNHVEFVETHWRLGEVPKQRELAAAEHRAMCLENILLRALDGLYSLGRLAPDLVEQAVSLNVVVPEHLRVP